MSKDTEDVVVEAKEEDKKIVKPIIEIIDYKEEIHLETSEIKIANKIAVMLPMTGKYAKIGKAILDGINISIEEIETTKKPDISIFDTGDSSIDIKEILENINSEDFSLIVGPLTKKNINQVYLYKNNNIPNITFNYSDSYIKKNKSIYQFGLLPEDEAICAANKALIDQKHNVIIIQPNNKWGERVGNAYKLRFEEFGGEVLSTVVYDVNDMQIGNLIKENIGVKESQLRKKQIEKLLNQKFIFTPFIREDIDAFFAVGTHKQMQIIKPQLDFNYAEGIQVYSSSHIYRGTKDKKLYKDLDEIIFCDIPWLYNKINLSDKEKFYSNNSKKKLLRFVALGIDVIKVFPYLAKLKDEKNKHIKLNTGYLSIDEFNKIRRNPIYVKFKNGLAKEYKK